LNNQPVEVNEDLFEDEDGFQTPQSSLLPSASKAVTGTRRGSDLAQDQPSPSRYDYANIRPNLRTAQFQEASRMQVHNMDEQAFFQ